MMVPTRPPPPITPATIPHDGPGFTIASVPAVLRLVLLAYVHAAANDGVEFIL
jgi:hypothetical protein